MSNLIGELSQTHLNPFRTLPAVPGRISVFFPDQKKHFFSGSLLIKIPILEELFPHFTHLLIRSSFPFNFNDCIHYFRQSINEFLSMRNWACLPDMRKCILPHDHCSFLSTVLFSTLNVKLRFLKTICKFCFSWLTKSWLRKYIII